MQGRDRARVLLLRQLTPDVVVGTVEHPQSRTMDFYRALGDLFGVPLHSHNRWAGFKTLRAHWTDHITSMLSRPVLIIDEAQEALTTVLNELRVLASKELDSRQLLCVVLAGDARLVDRLRSPELLPLGSRIRRRLSRSVRQGPEETHEDPNSPRCPASRGTRSVPLEPDISTWQKPGHFYLALTMTRLKVLSPSPRPESGRRRSSPRLDNHSLQRAIAARSATMSRVDGREAQA